jgi:RNA polymerase sigma factor (sigma-70 family)
MPTPPPHDEDLLAELGRVIRAERVGLARVARHEGLGPEDAIDCVQDAFCTFLRLSQEGGALPDDRARLPGFLAAIVRNAARNRRRSHRLARPHDALDALAGGDDGPSAEALVSLVEDHVRLRVCVARLCGPQRAIVTMRLLEERGGEDVAEALGISRGHVDVLLHRAKASLRACMIADEAPP